MIDQRKQTLARYRKFKAKRDAEIARKPAQKALPDDNVVRIRTLLLERSGGKCECEGGCGHEATREHWSEKNYLKRYGILEYYRLFCGWCYAAANDKISVTKQPQCCARLPR